MTFEPGKILTAADLNAALANYVPISALAATASGQGGTLVGLSNGDTVQAFIAKLVGASGAGIIGAQSGGSVQTFINTLMSSTGAAAIGYGTDTVKSALDAAFQAVSISQGFRGQLTTSVVAGGALPFEVTAITGGGGTGGTPGTYAGIVAGGPAGFKFQIFVGSDGKAVPQIVNPGLSTSNSAPTLTMPTIAGLTGATALSATVGTIPVNRVFDAPSTDSTKMLSWINNAGTLSPYPTTGTQFAYPQVSAAPYSWFTAASDETGALIRYRLNGRLLATWTVARGFYPSRMTIPGSAWVDDDFTNPITARLITAGFGTTFTNGAVESGTPFRLIWNKRELFRWDFYYGFTPAKMLIPAGAVVSDQPGVKLTDRLGGTGGAAGNASYTVVSQLTSAGKLQLVSLRKSDSAAFYLTDGTANATTPAITSDGANVTYWDASRARPMWVPIEGGSGGPVSPYDIIDCWGDSLTAGNGSSPAVPFTTVWRGNLPQQLARLLSGKVSAVNNFGVGGQISAEIAARQGGAPCLITVTGNTIPASGAVTVTAYSVDLLLQGTTSGQITVTGTLAGIPGTLSGSNSGTRGTSTYTFTRTTAGSSTPCPANTPFIPDNGVASRPNCQLLTYGRNDGTSSATPILNALAASVSYQTALEKRYLVGGVLAQIGDTLSAFTTINNAISAAYGARFVDLNAPPTAGEMTAIGFVPDSYGTYPNSRTDAGDIAAGYIPTGMRAGAFQGNGDYLHLNEFGYALWALRYYRKIRTLGWFPGLTAI